MRMSVRAAALNFRDVHTRRSQPGVTPGSDVAGVLHDTGQRVVAIVPNGGFAPEVDIDMYTLIPDEVSFEQAAIVPVAGLTASFLASMFPGDRIAVWAAAGGVGCFLGGLVGDHAIGITSPGKVDVARACGYAEVVTHDDEEAIEAIRGVDVVIDSVGGPLFARSVRMLAHEGTVVLCGRTAGEPDLASVQADLIGTRRNLGLRDFFLATTLLDHADEVPDRMHELLDHTSRVPITTFPMSDVDTALDLLESGTTAGKLVLRADKHHR